MTFCQLKDTQDNVHNYYTQRNSIQYKSTQHNDFQHIDIQHIGTQHVIIMRGIFDNMLSVFMLKVKAPSRENRIQI
jgi:hypothetical protein